MWEGWGLHVQKLGWLMGIPLHAYKYGCGAYDCMGWEAKVDQAIGSYAGRQRAVTTRSVHHWRPGNKGPMEVLLCWPKTSISIMKKK